MVGGSKSQHGVRAYENYKGPTFIFSFIEPFLVDDGVNGNSSFTAYTRKHYQLTALMSTCPVNSLPSLSVSDDEFSLSSPDGYEAVHSLNTCLHRLSYRDTRDDAGCLCSYSRSPISHDRTLGREGETQGLI